MIWGLLLHVSAKTTACRRPCASSTLLPTSVHVKVSVSSSPPARQYPKAKTRRGRKRNNQTSITAPLSCLLGQSPKQRLHPKVSLSDDDCNPWRNGETSSLSSHTNDENWILDSDDNDDNYMAPLTPQPRRKKMWAHSGSRHGTISERGTRSSQSRRLMQAPSLPASLSQHVYRAGGGSNSPRRRRRSRRIRTVWQDDESDHHDDTTNRYEDDDDNDYEESFSSDCLLLYGNGEYDNNNNDNMATTTTLHHSFPPRLPLTSVSSSRKLVV